MPGLSILGGHLPLASKADCETYEVTDDHAGYLAQMIKESAKNTQRFVEHMTFVPIGGLQWQRNLQIELPQTDDRALRWWILPLGPFNRRRLPDITVLNEAGEPLNLLTRKAHGLALTKAAFTMQFAELGPQASAQLASPALETRLRKLEQSVNNYLTEPTDKAVNLEALSGSDPAAIMEAEQHPRIANGDCIMDAYEDLLADAGASEDEIDTCWDSLSAILDQAIDTTQYLCWVYGKPGEVVNVRVSHTTADPQHSLKRKTIRSFFWATFTGLFTCTPPERAGRRKLRNELARPWEAATQGLTRLLKRGQPGPVRGWLGEVFEKFADQERRRNEAADWYRRFGLAPINYELNVPTFQHTASYYATIGSPEGTDLTYLDWKLGNSYEERQNEYSETSCSVHPVHIYNAAATAVADEDEKVDQDGEPKELDDGDAEDRGGLAATDTAAEAEEKHHPQSIRAYFRCTPLHHKQILGAAALNIVFVWLLSDGRLPGRPGDPLQGLVIAAPAVLVAFLAQQQRHYYEHALRPSRGILWCYLVVGGGFLVAVAFSGQKVSEGGPGIGDIATVAAWVLAISSVAIFVWHFPLGHMYEHIVGWLYRRRVEWGMETWQAYESAYEHFSQWLWRLVVIASLITIGVLAVIWDPPDGPPHKTESDVAQSVKVHQAQVVEPVGRAPDPR